jgi:glycine betaine/proline transport system substrate-binding protein
MLKKHIFAPACLLAGALAMNQTALGAEPDTCKVVRMADPGWTDIAVTNAMSGILLNALGYEQTVARLSVPISYIGMSKGQIDVFLGNWMPAQKEIIEPKIKDKSIEVLRPNLQNAKFTLAVPSYVAEAGVRSFADLAKFSDRFERKVYGIDAGAPANQNIKRMLGASKLGLEGWKLVETSEQGMLSQVARKTAVKGWVVFLGWEPHLMNTKFQLTYLDGGDEYFGRNYGGASVNTVARRGYATQCPNVGRLFSQLEFNVDLENRIITDVLEQNADVKATAARYLRERPELLDAWLAGVKTRSGAEGLPAVKKALQLN